MFKKLGRAAVLAAGSVAALCACAQAAAPVAPAAAASEAMAAAPVDAALAARGKRLFLRCVACHDATATGLPKTGPHLQGIVGRRAGAVDGYAYSPAMKGQAFSWDAARLDAWLVQPGAVVPDTSMVFIGMPDEQERRALIAFLRTLR